MKSRALIYGGLGAFLVSSWGALEIKSAHEAAKFPSSAASAVQIQPVPGPADKPALEREPLRAALRDPFVAEPVPASVPPPVPAPTAKALKPPQELPPSPPPTAPALNLQFSGRMRDPAGALIIYAALGNETVILAPGTELANGYRVVKITDQSVELLYPALNTTARLQIPAAPAFEVR